MAHAVVALATLALAACGSSASAAGIMAEPAVLALPPSPLAPDEAYFTPGEQMSFDLSLAGIKGGQSVIVVGDPGVVEDREIVIVRSRSESAGVAALIKQVTDDVTSWVDVTTSAPLYYRADMLFGDKHLEVETRFADDGLGPFALEYVKNDRSGRRHQIVPPDSVVFDAHGALFALRAWNAPVGARTYFYGLSGRRVWRIDIQVAERDTIRTAIGLTPAVRLDGYGVPLTSRGEPSKNKKPRTWSMWISDDENRLPLLVTSSSEWGEMRAELVDYRLPE